MNEPCCVYITCTLSSVFDVISSIVWVIIQSNVYCLTINYFKISVLHALIFLVIQLNFTIISWMIFSNVGEKFYLVKNYLWYVILPILKVYFVIYGFIRNNWIEYVKLCGIHVKVCYWLPLSEICACRQKRRIES